MSLEGGRRRRRRKKSPYVRKHRSLAPAGPLPKKRGTRSFALLHSLTCLLRNAALAPITLLLLPGIILKCSTAKTLFCCYVFVTMSVNPSISPSVHPSVCTAVCQSNGRFVIPFVCLFIGPSVHQFIRLAFLFLVLDKNRYFGRH